MRSPRALKASLVCMSFTALSLFHTGTAWGVAAVESRSGPGRYENQEQPPSLELMKKMEFLQQEVQELRGKVEEQTYQLQQLEAHQKKLYLDLDKRLREGNGAEKIGAGVTLDDEGSVSTTKASQVQMQVTSSAAAVSSEEGAQIEEKAYQNAYHLIQSRDYQGALGAFQTFVKNFPHGKYLPNAHYWLGEIYLTRGNMDLAANAFNMVYQNYPQHPKAADSLLKLGYVEYAKGQWKRSQELLSQVKRQFPGSTSAQLADARLQKMHQEGH